MLEFFTVALVAFLLGYCLGRRTGKAIGIIQGQTVAPLLLRQQSYEQGYCLLCKENLLETKQLFDE